MTQPETALKRTPLHAAHVRLGARMIPFGGWDMPVQYAGIVEEHRAVRSAVGCFDVSHMGEFEFRGPDALRALQRLTTNDVSTLEVGQVQYSLLCYEDGGIVDDLTLYRLADDHYMMTVERLQHRQGLGVGHAPPRRVGRSGGRAERERGDGADRRPGAARRAAGGAPVRRGRPGDRLLPLPPWPGGGRAGHRLAHGLHRGGRVRAVSAGGRHRDGVGAPPGRGQDGRRGAHRSRRPGHAPARDEVRALRQRHRRDDESARGGARLGGEARQGGLRRPGGHRERSARRGSGAASPASRWSSGRWPATATPFSTRARRSAW